MSNSKVNEERKGEKMKKIKQVLPLVLVSSVILVTGCTQTQENVTGGAVIGTAIGAGIGAASGNAGTGAAIGAAAGALGGAAISK